MRLRDELKHATYPINLNSDAPRAIDVRRVYAVPESPSGRFRRLTLGARASNRFQVTLETLQNGDVPSLVTSCQHPFVAIYLG